MYFYRKQRPVRGQHPAIGRWHGVCRVIGHDVPSGGAGRSQGHSTWLNYQAWNSCGGRRRRRSWPGTSQATWRLKLVLTDILVTYADVRWRQTSPEEPTEDEPSSGAAAPGFAIPQAVPALLPVIEEVTALEPRSPVEEAVGNTETQEPSPQGEPQAWLLQGDSGQ